MKTILKIDVDFKLPKKWVEMWKASRKGMLESLGFKVSDIVIHPSDKRGFHAWIHMETNGSKLRMTPTDKNRLQWLCGDDVGRVLINQARIKRGIDWDKGNKLFSKVLYRSKMNSACKNCKAHLLRMETMKDFQGGK